MDSRLATLGVNTNTNDTEFNCIDFEKRLMQLKDSQESINALSAWCMENRLHHKKIVNAWLSVLKKVKVEQRLTLFYLANDVIQYSKRKNYDFVESWGTTLQKATTLVREEKVKNKILRIFKIWEQRGIYGEEFITDLSGLISASTAGRKLDQDPQEFQTSYLITRIRSCAKLESDTDLKLKNLKDSSPKITDSESLCASLKDRQHVEDVEKEVESGITLIEAYVNALKAEIKSRTHLVSVLSQADTFYNTERKEVKVVVSAYKNFTTRVKTLKRKLDELKPTLNSPIPSPDVNAPSPSPDSDIELPNHDTSTTAAGVNVYSMTETYNAGYYQPAPQNQQNFANNGFSSFMGSNMPFDIQNFTSGNMFTDQNHEAYSCTHDSQHMADSIYTQTSQQQQSVGGLGGGSGGGYEATQPSYNPQQPHQQPAYNQPQAAYNQPQPATPQQQQQQPVAPVAASAECVYGQPPVTSQPQAAGIYIEQAQPLMPPPMPPFSTSGYVDSASYNDPTYVTAADSYANNPTYEAVGNTPYAVTSEIQSSYQQQPDAYNPEEDVETWDPENWDGAPDLETPESPPIFEKEGFADPIEYDDSKNVHTGLIKDVDHRVLLPPPQMPPELTGPDTDHRNAKDVDHRNLISLTGSPGHEPMRNVLQPPPAPPPLWVGQDQDYRHVQDQDYRMPADIAQQLKLPPPPPPPHKGSPKKSGNHDNVESIDMELSDDESCSANNSGSGPILPQQEQQVPFANIHLNNNNRRNHRPFNNGNNKKIATVVDPILLEPPPPIPQNLCEIPEANNLEGNGEDRLDSGNEMNGVIPQQPHMEMEELLIGRQMLGGGPPPPPQLVVGPPPPSWTDDWFDERPPPPFADRLLPPNFINRHKNEFRGGYRGRGMGNNRGGGNFQHDDVEGLWRGRGRGGRGSGGGRMRSRPPRGANMRGFNGRGRGFRGQFRGGF